MYASDVKIRDAYAIEHAKATMSMIMNLCFRTSKNHSTQYTRVRIQNWKINECTSILFCASAAINKFPEDFFFSSFTPFHCVDYVRFGFCLPTFDRVLYGIVLLFYSIVVFYMNRRRKSSRAAKNDCFKLLPKNPKDAFENVISYGLS